MGNRIKGITVEIGGDTTGLDKALRGVNSSITKTQSALNDVNKLLKLDPSNTVLVAQKQQLLSQAVSQTSDKLEALESAQEQVTAAFQRGDIGQDKYQAFHSLFFTKSGVWEKSFGCKNYSGPYGENHGFDSTWSKN